MAYYILREGYRLRGYRKLPFALMHPDLHNTDFFDREQYALVLDCNGCTDIDPVALTDRQRLVFDNMIKAHIIRECEKGEALLPEQEYRLYPATYKSRVQWSITGRCNYRCRHCFLSAPDYRGDDMSLADCIRVLDQLCECGIFSVSITGGEPLVHKELYPLLSEIAKRGMALDAIYTNCALVDETLLDRLDALHMRPAFNVSFDGVGCHDWLRGIPGAERKATDTIRLLKARGYFVGASMALHRGNIGSLRETVKLLAQLGCDHLKANGMSYQGNWLEQSDSYMSETETFDHLLGYIPQYFEDGAPLSMQIGIMLEYDKRRNRMTIPAAMGADDERSESTPACGVVKRCMYIASDGKVLPCMSFAGHPLEDNFDSVFDKPLADIINDSCYSVCSNAACAQCITHNEQCRDCRYRWMCKAGCRAGACDNGKTDYYGIDERACTFFKNGYYEKVRSLIDEIPAVYKSGK